MQFRFVIIFLLLFASSSSFSQRNCGTYNYNQQKFFKDSLLFYRIQAQEENIQQWILRNKSKKKSSIVTIPVVVHIVYYSNIENISDAQIFSQIEILNKDFRRLNVDTVNTPNSFRSLAADCEIEFCLAQRDPNGNVTNGITRTQTTQTSFTTNDNVKYDASGGKDAWNTNKYLNIWVCDVSGGILGYAQYPGGNPNEDGVVVDYQYFGNIGTALSPYDLGRTTTHEVGHWLNLKHIWGDSNCGDDQCGDTPEHEGPNYGCPSYPHISSCSANGLFGDMFQNFMDYTDDDCMNLFTNDQKLRMIATINTSRQGLLTSNGCNNDYGCTDSLAINYNNLAIYDDSSCCYISGCTDTSFFNFDSTACFDDGSCANAVLGCNVVGSVNYDSLANTTIAYGGPKNNNIGSGAYTDLNRHLYFDAYKPFKLKSAVVYSQSSNTITFELRNNNSIVVEDTTITVSPGAQRLYFDFDVPIGIDYQLGVASDSSNLYRNSSGTSYPYDIGSAMIITRSNASSSPTGYYYFYYDIEIEASCVISGCTDTTAANFNPSANVTDSSCCYVKGCTNIFAANYDSLACFEDSSCCYTKTVNIDTIACDNFTYNGGVYHNSGLYSFVYNSSCGFDSTVNINLIVENSDTSFFYKSSCDTFLWNGVSYTSSGIFSWQGITKSGCDSTSFLNLQINNSYSNISTVDTCDEYKWYGNLFTSSGVYSENFTNTLGCDSTIYLSLNLTTSPSLSISQSGSILIASPLGGDIPYNYLWSNGDTTSTINPMANGTYWLVVKDLNGCFSDTVFANVDFVPSSISNVYQQFKIYPNPAEDLIYIISEKDEIGSIEITNSLGQIVISRKFKKMNSKVDISNLENGTYFFNVFGQQTYFNKVILKK